jgi:hypothetical protein
MSYVLATVEVPDQQRQYYAGLDRQIFGRMAHQVTPFMDHATRFTTSDEAEARCKELGGGYIVIPANGRV